MVKHKTTRWFKKYKCGKYKPAVKNPRQSTVHSRQGCQKT